MTGDPLTIPDAVQHRLEAVDDAIDETRRDRFERSGPVELAVVPGRVIVRPRRPRVAPVTDRPSARLVASVAIVLSAVIAFGWFGSSGVGTGVPTSSAVGIASSDVPSARPSVLGATTAEPTPTLPAPSPQATEAAVRTVRSKGSAIVILQKELRSTCLSKPAPVGPMPQKSFIFPAASRATGPGWLDAAQTVWFGADPSAAARAFGSSVLVVGLDGSWVVIVGEAGAEARELATMTLPTGVAYWLGVRVSAGPCP